MSFKGISLSFLENLPKMRVSSVIIKGWQRFGSWMKQTIAHINNIEPGTNDIIINPNDQFPRTNKKITQIIALNSIRTPPKILKFRLFLLLFMDSTKRYFLFFAFFSGLGISSPTISFLFISELTLTPPQWSMPVNQGSGRTGKHLWRCNVYPCWPSVIEPWIVAAE